ncbi:MAG: helix-turn-helix transcriptional regulator [Anaerorhabdus sp.]
MKNENKIKLLYLVDLFSKYSDENHILSMPEILDYLDQKGISAERKSIYDDIKILERWGMDIIFIRGKKQGYYLANSKLDLVEIKIICDMIASSQFLSNKKSKQLINKCCNLTSKYHKEVIENQVFLSDKKKDNIYIYYSIDKIQEAIIKKSSISFKYFDTTINNIKKYRKNAELYHIIPLSLLFENNRYYCIGYSKKHQSLTHYRMDKIEDVKIENKYELTKELSIKKYISTNFKMSLGEIENVSITFNNQLYSSVTDFLGNDLFLEKINGDTFTINLDTTISNSFISWILGFGNQAKINKPQKLINIIVAKTNEILKSYQS